LIRATEECLPRTARQRCLAHKMRNLQSKVPEPLWPEFKACAITCYQAASPALARLLRDEIVGSYGRELASAVACFQDDFEAWIAHLKFPLAHRRAIRTTNLLERLFGEERRRTKVIPHAFGERAILKLMYGALIRAAELSAGAAYVFERRRHWPERGPVALSASNCGHNVWDKPRIILNYLRLASFLYKTRD
jgi:putative transposase